MGLEFKAMDVTGSVMIAAYVARAHTWTPEGMLAPFCASEWIALNVVAGVGNKCAEGCT